MPLLGPDGRPIEVSTFKKADPPKMGPAFGNWAGRDVIFNQMPGGAILQFDLSKLTLDDYRAMRWNPQINASLSILTFMIHQIDWWIECEDNKIAQQVEDNLRVTWTRMIRGMSQAFWAGYSPIVLEFENNVPNKTIDVTKFKDLMPEECKVNWKEVEGYAPPGKVKPKHKVYNGIKQIGAPYPVPPENTLWYPLLMENGDYYGRKLLKAAFAPWYFSTLIHLFANRYYERFGEPVPVGRAPFDADIDVGNGEVKTGKEVMEVLLMSLRNRAVVTLPDERDPVTKEFLYDISYLESQMRGADFERYLARLDEEMSLAIFTPMLLMRTGDVGSNNLGVQHTQTYLWMVNALAGDMKEYIDKYICERIKAINFSPNAPRVEWKFRKLGKESVETTRAIMQALLGADKVKVDLDELGMALGMTLKEVRQVTDPNADPNGPPDPNAPPDNRDRSTRGDKSVKKGRGVGEPRATGREIANRLKGQVERAFQTGNFGSGFKPSLGYERRMVQAFRTEGHDDPEKITTDLYGRLDRWLNEAVALGKDEYSGPQDFMAMFERLLDSELEAVA